MLKAGVSRQRLEAWARHGDPVVDQVAQAIRRGVDPTGLLALYERPPFDHPVAVNMSDEPMGEEHVEAALWSDEDNMADEGYDTRRSTFA